MLAVSSLLTLTPPLENGDRLTRAEFERRYCAMPHLKKAELVEGVVYMASPVRVRRHGKPHALVMTWLGSYWAATPGVDLADNTTVRLDADNEVQPDAYLRLETGGNSEISEDDYLEGAPELVVEIAASSASYDLNDKLEAYRRNGVEEYLVWQSYEARLDWFRLREGKYFPLNADQNGIIRSEVFPGLWLSVRAFRAENAAEIVAVLQEGLRSREHRQFLEQLSG